MSRSVDVMGESIAHRFPEQGREPAYPETAGSLLAATLREASLSEGSDREKRADFLPDI